MEKKFKTFNEVLDYMTATLNSDKKINETASINGHIILFRSTTFNGKVKEVGMYNVGLDKYPTVFNVYISNFILPKRFIECVGLPINFIK